MWRTEDRRCFSEDMMLLLSLEECGVCQAGRSMLEETAAWRWRGAWDVKGPAWDLPFAQSLGQRRKGLSREAMGARLRDFGVITSCSWE